MEPNEPPAEFKCPLSGVLMRDPVTLCTGVTYERGSIVNFLADRNKTVCPISGKHIEHREVWPNRTLRRLILAWHTENEAYPPEPIVEEVTSTEISEGLRLLTEIQSSSASCHLSLMNLKSLLLRNPAISSIFGNHKLMPETLLLADFGSELIDIVYMITSNEDAATLQALTRDPAVTSLLFRGLYSDCVQRKKYAVSSFHHLCKMESYKYVVGACGALERIFAFAEEQDYELFKAACFAMERMCKSNERNKQRVVKFDGIPPLLDRVKSDTGLVIPILYLFLKVPLACSRMCELRAVPDFLSILRRDHEDAGVMRMCISLTSTFYSEEQVHIIQEEEEHGTISKLAQHGDAAVKRMAQDLLNGINESLNQRGAV